MLGMIFLSDNERAQLKAQHKRERDKRICDRIKAVLLCDKGWSVPAIAEVQSKLESNRTIMEVDERACYL
jgi:hypothetical protein